jgi:hypothetical protein
VSTHHPPEAGPAWSSYERPPPAPARLPQKSGGFVAPALLPFCLINALFLPTPTIKAAKSLLRRPPFQCPCIDNPVYVLVTASLVLLPRRYHPHPLLIFRPPNSFSIQKICVFVLTDSLRWPLSLRAHSLYFPTCKEEKRREEREKKDGPS